MSSRTARSPLFAGIALVDILANGVAVLIIVIVLSIASRFEQEQQFNERIQEVSTVMTREFSTSLVLNRLAAGPPAQLHDYENSELDAIWHPVILPVLEIHRDVVRDPYTNRVWHRNELLQEPNSLDDFLANFDAFQRERLRGDFYDIGTFYLLMSILNDHGIRIAHWHFMGVQGIGASVESANACPPGLSYKDCAGGGGGSTDAGLASMLESLGNSQSEGEQSEGGDWPPGDLGLERGGQAGTTGTGALPEGAQLGPSSMGELESGTFPDARASRNALFGQGSGQGSGGDGSASGSGQGISVRLADPTLEALSIEGLNIGALQASPEAFFIAFMGYLSVVQTMYDNGEPPTELLQQLVPTIQGFLEEPPELSEEQLYAIEDLTLALSVRSPVGEDPEPLLMVTMPPSANPEALLRIPVNRMLIEAEIESNHPAQLKAMPEEAKIRFNLQAYPEIWRGLQVALERDSVVMMSPDQHDLDIPKWRAVVYLAPQLDDFIVGFVYGTVDADGHLEILADPNQGLIDTRQLTPHWEADPFSIQTWMTLLYVLAGIALITLLFFWRPGLRTRR